MNGKWVKLVLVDGTPGGLTTAEITNWTGHVLSARRSDLAALLKREEAGAFTLLSGSRVEGRAGLVTHDIVVSSPSTAGAVALGRSCNGPVEWASPEAPFGAWESRGVG